MRLRTKKHEIIITPGKPTPQLPLPYFNAEVEGVAVAVGTVDEKYLLVVLQDPS